MFKTIKMHIWFERLYNGVAVREIFCNFAVYDR